MFQNLNSNEKPLRLEEDTPLSTGRRVKLMVRKLLFNVWRTLPGAYRYHFAPRKSICLIVSPMRSGSTLLKALLAEAEDISSLPEMDTRNYKRCTPQSIYHHVTGLAQEPIIVMKRPGIPWIPFSPKFMRLKVIILCRDLAAVCASIEQVTKEVSDIYPVPWTREEAVRYWCDIYENILNNKTLWEHDTYMCRYEKLLADPNKTTQKLYSFIGTVRKEGVDSYSKPEGYQWEWGSDDSSGKIKSLTVRRAPLPGVDPPPGWEEYYALPRVENLRQKLGYTAGLHAATGKAL